VSALCPEPQHPNCPAVRRSRDKHAAKTGTSQARYSFFTSHSFCFRSAFLGAVDTG
jgi:hypothetical protein